MLLYLDLSYDQARRDGRLRNLADLREAVIHGAAKRLRPKFMTFATTCIGLFPIMWSIGTGSEVMKRIAAPMVGGIFDSFVLELLVYPVINEIWKWPAVKQQAKEGSRGIRAYSGEPGLLAGNRKHTTLVAYLALIRPLGCFS